MPQVHWNQIKKIYKRIYSFIFERLLQLNRCQKAECLMLRIGQQSTMTAHIFTFAPQLLQHRAHIGVGEPMRRSSVHVVTVRIDCEYEHGNVRHGAHIDKLLNGIGDVPFVAKEIGYALNHIARCVDNDSSGKHLQRFTIPLRPIGLWCPWPMEQCFECVQMQPIEVKQLQYTTQGNSISIFKSFRLRLMSREPAKFERSSNTSASLTILSIRLQWNMFATPTGLRFVDTDEPNFTKSKLQTLFGCKTLEIRHLRLSKWTAYPNCSLTSMLFDVQKLADVPSQWKRCHNQSAGPARRRISLTENWQKKYQLESIAT